MGRTPRPCSKCPVRDGNGICVVRAKWMSAHHPSCAYGRKLMNNELSAEYNRKRFGWKKREPKPYTPPEDEEETPQ